MSAQETLTLPPSLDIAAVEGLREQLLARRGRPLLLDASGVEQVGGLGLQVLLAAKATWTADGQPLSVAQSSPAFLTSLSLMGVDEQLDA